MDIYPYSTVASLHHDLEQYGVDTTLTYMHSKGNGGEGMEEYLRRLLREGVPDHDAIHPALRRALKRRKLIFLQMIDNEVGSTA
ncbi:hypothetical protein [Candidatus Poriferisodalis sp.]|uniref:hypothetical protein n=1 Tax=Candidatus Poriferisodalis sp. TaxID=3101277 RepID=UPI003B028755